MTSLRNAAITLVLLNALISPMAQAQNAASRASEASLAASVEVPAAALALLAEGGKFSVTAVRPVGQSVQVVVSATADGVSFVVEMSAEAASAAGVVVGKAISITVVSAGYVLSVGTSAIAFVPSALAESMIHHEELSR